MVRVAHAPGIPAFDSFGFIRCRVDAFRVILAATLRAIPVHRWGECCGRPLRRPGGSSSYPVDMRNVVAGYVGIGSVIAWLLRLDRGMGTVSGRVAVVVVEVVAWPAVLIGRALESGDPEWDDL